MDARSLATSSEPIGSAGRPLARLALVVALATCLLLAALSGLFLVRRVSGGFAQAPPPAVFLSCGAVLLAATCVVRLLPTRLDTLHRAQWLPLTLLVLPAVTVLMLVGSLTYFTAPLWPPVLIWLAIAAEEGVWWTLYFRSRRSAVHTSGEAPRIAAVEESTTRRLLGGPTGDLESDCDADPELIADNVVQKVTRVREAQGESLSGVLRGDFLAGERTQNLHLAFCPPLARAPEFLFEQVGGPPVSIKAAQVETFGVRLEVRLSSSQPEPASVLIEFSARS